MSIVINEVIEMDGKGDNEFKEKKRKSFDDEKDLEEFKEVMNTLRDTVPAIIRGIVEAVYSAQDAEDFGKQVAGFYKAMIDAGMSNEQAFQLTKEFMESRDVTGIIKKILSEGRWKEWSRYSEEDVKEMKEELKKKTMEEMKKDEEE